MDIPFAVQWDNGSFWKTFNSINVVFLSFEFARKRDYTWNSLPAFNGRTLFAYYTLDASSSTSFVNTIRFDQNDTDRCEMGVFSICHPSPGVPTEQSRIKNYMYETFKPISDNLARTSYLPVEKNYVQSTGVGRGNKYDTRLPFMNCNFLKKRVHRDRICPLRVLRSVRHEIYE